MIRPRVAFFFPLSLAIAGCEESSPPDPTTTLLVETVTTGATPDGDGYRVRVNDAGSRPLPVTGSVTVGTLSPGNYTVELSGLQINCDIPSGTTQSLTVAENQDTVTVSFAVSCPLALDGHLLYTGSGTYVGGSIYRAEPDGSGEIELGDPAEGNDYPSVSPSNTLIAFIRRTPSALTLSVIAPDGSGRRDLPTPAVTSLYQPVWSPDGSRIVMVGNKNGTWGLYISEVNGTNSYPITPVDLQGVNMLGWSPDGSEVLYNVHHPDSAYLALAASDGSGWHVPAWSSNRDQALDWSAHFDRILFFRPANDSVTNGTLYSVRPDGTGLIPLTGDTVRVLEARMQPVYGRIVFFETSTQTMFLTEANGDRLNPLPMNGGGFQWTPDGSRLTFLEFTLDNDYDVFAADPDGSNVVDLTQRPGKEVDFTWARKLQPYVTP